MAYIDDWLAAMTEGVDPQQAAEFQNTARGGATVNYSGPEGTFRTLPMEPGGPGPAPGRTLQDILAEIGISGATDPRAIQAAQSRESALLSGGYRGNNEAARQGFSARTYAEMAGRDRAAEARLAYEDSLARGAQQGNPNAVAEMNRRKAINDANQLNFKTLVDLAKGDPETASALLGKLMPGLPTMRTKEQRIADETRAKVGATEEVQQGMRPPKVPAAGGIVDKETGQMFEPTAFTQAEFNAAKDKYKVVDKAGRDQIGYIEGTVLPALDQMREIVPRLAVKGKGENLSNWIKLELAKGTGIDPDVQQYVNLRTKLALEESKVVTGSARTMATVFNQLENTTLPQLKQTLDVQMRSLDNDGWEFNNRLRSLKGQKPVSFKDWQAAQGQAGGGQGGGRQFTKEAAMQYLRKFGGDRTKAEAAARADGYQF